MRSWNRRTTAICAAVAAFALGAGTAAVAAGALAARTGTVIGTCANPVLERDLTGWGRHNTGAAGSRVAVGAHVVADHAYVQPAANGANPEMYLPQKDVSAGEQWRFAMDTWVSGSAATVQARMQVDWYNAAGGYLGHVNGTESAVPVTTAEQWTRVAGDFTAPAGAARANVTARIAGPAGLTWAATACDYRPAGEGGQNPQPTTPPPTTPAGDTAASRFGWGTPLPASDEFDYGSAAAPAVPDRTKWELAGDGVGQCMNGHNGNGRRCDANSRVLGGILRMTGEADGDTGWLGSTLSQKYGRWEVRARSQATGANNGRQYHPVLITWPESNEWPEGAEYDYLENSAPGEQCAGAFLHYPNHQPRTQEHAEKCGVDLTQWHNFGFEWTRQHLKGYIDGVEWFSFSRDCVQCAPGPMFQTIQLDNFFGGSMQPAVFEMDWARVYAVTG
ncbi:glycoside hydrolase family 16 protein [Actinoplanes sp. NPDC023801]|uniref:glycoside hydrolase family 16 protein n=1 Tax=Actinoplanes sp. NPDC023801 TaxID=3154595 RepID=UPI0033CD4BE1